MESKSSHEEHSERLKKDDRTKELEELEREIERIEIEIEPKSKTSNKTEDNKLERIPHQIETIEVSTVLPNNGLVRSSRKNRPEKTSKKVR